MAYAPNYRKRKTACGFVIYLNLRAVGTTCKFSFE